MRPSVPLLLASAVADGTALTASTAAASILHGSGKAAIAGGALDVGTILKLIVRGSMGVGASGAGAIGFDIRLGSVVLSSFGTMSLRTSSCSAETFVAEMTATVRNNSTAGNVISSMTFTGPQACGATATTSAGSTSNISPVVTLPAAGPGIGAAFDASAGGLFDCFGTWTVSTSGNTLTVNQSELWIMN